MLFFGKILFQTKEQRNFIVLQKRWLSVPSRFDRRFITLIVRNAGQLKS